MEITKNLTRYIFLLYNNYTNLILGEKKMKTILKRLTALSVLVMLLFSINVFAQDDVKSDVKATIKVGSANITQSAQDAIVSIPITFEGDLVLTAFQLQISTEAGVEFTGFTKGDVIDGIIEPKTGVTPVALLFIDTTVTGVKMKSGTLATLEYKIPASQVKEYKLLLTAEDIIDAEYKDIKSSIALESGSIKVEAVNVSGGSSVEETMTAEERKSDVVCMKIDKSTAIAYGKKRQIDEKNRQVVPYLSGDRTMVPLRFVSETLGADILWEEGWDGCVVKKGDKEIKLTFGSAVFLVNGEEVTFDAPIEMLHDRTMVPVRFFSEQLGCDVYWEPINSLVVISPKDNPWVPERKSEIRAINEMLISIYGIL